MNKKTVVSVTISVFVTVLLVAPISFRTGVIAEQSGDTPESGVTSYIKQIYQSLVGLGYGSDSAGSWGNWGAFWNRIRSAGEWTPGGTAGTDQVVSGETFYVGSRIPLTGTLTLSGDARPEDVLSGMTFYSDSLEKQTGSAPDPIDYSLQSLETVDDNTSEYREEEALWVEVAGSPFAEYGDLNLVSGKVMEDTRTALIWSASSTGTMTNIFTLPGDGQRPIDGNAIAFCEGLNTAEYAGVDGWYVPTQKELMQGYQDGIYSQDPTFGTTNYFWSSTQYSGLQFNAWRVYLNYGFTGYISKTSLNSVRCVFRD